MPHAAPTRLRRLTILAFMAGLSTTVAGEDDRGPWWTAERAEAQAIWEQALNAVPTRGGLATWHDLLTTEPHVAGTDGDRRVVEMLVAEHELMGLDVERHEFVTLLARPVSASVDIVIVPPDAPPPPPDGLSLIESPLEEDPDSMNPELWPGWNAYSGSGTAVGPVVYANYGTKEDFEVLRERGIELAGRIVIARYGRNFRGFKAKFAEEAGAAGLILFTDPDDSGYRRGLPYPEGGWANPTSIQRGSIKTLPYPGDPLTPFVEATADAERLDPEQVALPRIPVQPMGWGSAREILVRMRGPEVPEGWQGGLPFRYRISGGPKLILRMTVEQDRALYPCTNVLASLRGTEYPDEKVIVGCHFDAWAYGAGDPHAGSIVLMEMARSFAEQARRGVRPARTIVFAHWAAEEFGIIGSTEWCEGNHDDLTANAVAYVNLDAAAMGPDFHASSAPTLKRLIEEAAADVPQARGEPGQTVFDHWAARGSDGRPSFGNLGGGSDHVGFVCHLGVPACSLGSGGAAGTAYHSNYDTVAWYRLAVGLDYEPALMVTRVTNVVVARLAGADVVPLTPQAWATDTRTHLEALTKRAGLLEVAVDFTPLEAAIDDFAKAAKRLERDLVATEAAGELTAERCARLNRALLGLERAWLSSEGLPGRPWFRSLYAASDPESGYAAWMLPGLRHAIETRDPAAVADAVAACAVVFRRLATESRAVVPLVGPDR